MNTLTIWSGYMLESWHNASLLDFGRLALAVIVLGWFISRMSSR